MANARARGSYEERKSQAIAAGRRKPDCHLEPVTPRAHGVALMPFTLKWSRSPFVNRKPVRSWTRRAHNARGLTTKLRRMGLTKSDTLNADKS